MNLYAKARRNTSFESKGPYTTCLGLALMFAASLAVAALTGCSGDFGAVGAAAGVQGVSLQGNVHGGQQPLVGAHIYLFAAGKTGYGSASTSLLNKLLPAVSTDTNGNGYVLSGAGGSFSITGEWSCVNSTDQLYILVTGGNPGLAAGTNNTAVAMMGALGTCSSINASTFVVVNELSTVAAVTALQQFMTDGLHIGSSSTNAVGLANAFTTVTNLVPTGIAAARTVTPGGNGTVPMATLDTLADILAACVNTASGASTQCSTLFSNTTVGPTVPADTLAAARNIALYPTQNVAALYALLAGVTAFQPTLTSAPADWTIGINYSLGSGVAEPGYLAIDGGGNVWITNRASEKSPYTASDSIIKLGPSGDILSGPTGFTNGGFVFLPEGLALDDLGNVWVANTSSTVLKMTNTGANATGFPFFGGDYPQGIAIDVAGNAWVSNSRDGSVMQIAKDGTLLNAGISSPNFSSPQGVALDTNGSIWVAGQGSNSVLKIGSDFSLQSGTDLGFTGGGLNAPSGVALDSSNRAWVVNSFYGSGNTSLSLFANNGTAVSTTAGFGNGARGYENLIVIDGANTAWTASCGPNCVGSGSVDYVLHLGTNGAVLNGGKPFLTPGLNTPQGIGVDASGNLWIANTTRSQFQDIPGTVTEIVGVAAPVKTPIQAALKANLLGQRP